MPLVNSKYKANGVFNSAHINTIYSGYFRKVKSPNYIRERIDTPDNDFFHIDWIENKSKHCVVLLHGLMGSSNSRYIKGITNHIQAYGVNVCAMNCRNCSGVVNNSVKTFHAGFTDDLELLFNYLESLNKFNSVSIISFSMGGSILLNYLTKRKVNPILKCAVCISSPLVLHEGAALLAKPTNKVYMRYFRNKIKRATLNKKKQLADAGVDIDQVNKADNFFDIDSLYTAKVFGFKDVTEYYNSASTFNFLNKISIPTLLLNAADDMMLGPSSYPIDIAEKQKHLYFEMSLKGGHVGYNQKSGVYFDNRSFQFINEKISIQ